MEARTERRATELLEMMAENRPLPATLDQLARLVEGQTPGGRCAILLLEGGLLRCAAAPTLPAEFTEAVRDIENPLAPACFEFVSNFGLRFASAAPILSAAGVLLGSLVVFLPSSHQGTPTEQESLRLAARLATIAVEQRQLTDRLAYQAQHDFLTGLPNRFRLIELLEVHLTEPQNDCSLAVLYIDLDRFKQINDSLGHSVGDRLLIEVAERLKAGLRSNRDVAARMGGDEFTVVLTNTCDEQPARALLESLRAPYLIDGRELFVTASIGMSFFPKHGQDASTLLRAADSAMYRAKNDGANGLECFSTDTQPSAMERLDLENALRRALEKSEFELLYQPIAKMNGEWDGFEALLSWNHATRGRIPANQFIPMAEETGLIVPIGSWVLRQACQHGARWLGMGLPVRRIAVNVSALQFARANFIETVAGALAANGFPPRLLELELTESLVLRDIGESIHRMAQLHELGVTMSIDDFGTGYSSLNYLRRLPVDGLKIDQSFLRDLESASGTFAVVQTIVSLAHSMQLTVVAEGVETAEELELLRAAGCDRVQGHLIALPMKAGDVERLLLAAT